MPWGDNAPPLTPAQRRRPVRVTLTGEELALILATFGMALCDDLGEDPSVCERVVMNLGPRLIKDVIDKLEVALAHATRA